MDLFGPVNVMYLSKKKYALVIVDDFSRYNWVKFLHSKDEAPQIIIDHLTKTHNTAQANVVALRLIMEQNSGMLYLKTSV